MLAKGIVEEILSPYSIRVRIPTIHGIKSSNTSTPTSKLGCGPICTLPHCDINLQVNDVVIVGFENNDYNKPIVLGVMYMSRASSTMAELELETLKVNTSVNLPYNTTIGNVTPERLDKLAHITEDVQVQLNSNRSDITKLTTHLNDLIKLLENLNFIDAGNSSQLQL